jgi:hypothetical protein
MEEQHPYRETTPAKHDFLLAVSFIRVNPLNPCDPCRVFGFPNKKPSLNGWAHEEIEIH